jgi:Helicase HerA-like C-terminal
VVVYPAALVSDFAKTIADAYANEGLAIQVGKGVLDGKLQDAHVRLPLRTTNRHELIARRDRDRQDANASGSDGRGVPTPVVHTKIRPPRSRMKAADDVAGAAAASPLAAKYATRLDSQSARELLAARLETPEKPPLVTEEHRKAARATNDGLGDFLNSRQGRAMQREVIRGGFRMLRKNL